MFSRSSNVVYDERIIQKVMVTSLLVEAEVQLFSDGSIFFRNFDTKSADITLGPIVQPAVVENELHVVHEVLDPLILVFLKLRFDGLEVHRILHDRWVVNNPEFLVIDWVSEDVRLLVALKRRK